MREYSILPRKDTATSRVVPDLVPPSALAKTLIVDTLGWLLAWRPAWAAFLGKIVSRTWRGFGRA